MTAPTTPTAATFTGANGGAPGDGDCVGDMVRAAVADGEVVVLADAVEVEVVVAGQEAQQTVGASTASRQSHAEHTTSKLIGEKGGDVMKQTIMSTQQVLYAWA